MRLTEHVEVDPDVCHGQARLVGTRIPVAVVLESLAEGLSVDQILAQYPTLTAGLIAGAIAYGALLAREEILPAESSSA